MSDKEQEQLTPEIRALIETRNQQNFSEANILTKLFETLGLIHTETRICQSEVSENDKRAGRIEQRLAALCANQADEAHIIEQLQLQTSGLVQKLDELASDWVDVQVRAPLLEILVRIYSSIYHIRDDVPHIKDVTEQILSVLEEYHSELISPNSGIEFDPKLHRPIKRVETDDSNLNGMVASLIQHGLLMRGKVIRHASVNVFIFNTTTNSPENEHTNQIS